MVRFQRYIFAQALWPVLGVLAGLALVGLLSQSLANLDLIVNKRQSALALLWITLLTLPQVIALVLPLAVFFAVLYALQRMQGESELVIAYSAGMSPWQAAAPILRLAVAAALAHLVLTTLVQPLAFREMRSALQEIASDLAASAMRPGAFLEPTKGLTIYAREERGGRLLDVLLHDARQADRISTYTAAEATFGRTPAGPTLILVNGDFQTRNPKGQLDFGQYERYTLELPELFAQTFRFWKPTDRFLGELLFPDPTHYYDQRNLDRLMAEGHYRLASPLYTLALAAIAAAALLSGEFRRQGYRNRLLAATGIALLVRLAALALHGVSVDAPNLNWLQYAAPLAALFVAGLLVAQPRLRAAPVLAPSGAAARA